MKLSPIAVWRTRASPGPGSPTSYCSTFRTSGPPCCSILIRLAILVLLLFGW